MASIPLTRAGTLLRACCIGLSLCALPCLAEPPPAAGEARPAPAVPRTIIVNVLFVQTSAKTAAEWGLDGGPAPNPAATPLKKDIPRVLQPEDMRTLMTAFRTQAETSIPGSAMLLTLSSQTASCERVVEMPVFDPPAAPPAPASAPPAAGANAPVPGAPTAPPPEPAVPTAAGPDAPAPVMPPGPPGLWPVVAPTAAPANTPPPVPPLPVKPVRCGTMLVVTPTLADDQQTVDVEIKPAISQLLGWVAAKDQKKACVAYADLETHVILQAKQTVILGTVHFALPTASMVDGAPPFADPRPVIIFLTVDVQ